MVETGGLIPISRLQQLIALSGLAALPSEPIRRLVLLVSLAALSFSSAAANKLANNLGRGSCHLAFDAHR